MATTLEKLGYVIPDPRPKTKTELSPIAPEDDQYASPISSGGYFGYYLEQGAEKLNEFHLIRTYREMSLLPEVDSAIEDITNEAINSDLNEPPVVIDLQKLDASKNIKNKISEEFDNVLRLLDFDDKAHQIFRRWYIDGRLFFHKIIDVKKPQEGIKELRIIDPLKIKKVRVKKPKESKDKLSSLTFGDVDEFFVYKPNGFLNKFMATTTTGTSVPLTKDAVTYVTSGATDYNRQNVVSYLHKAIKASNQLQMIQDAAIIYYISRAPERRIFYVDVGNLPTPKAEQYMKQIMNRYRTKIQYDANTGYIKDGKKHMSMLEDFFIPRKDGCFSLDTKIKLLDGRDVELGQLIVEHKAGKQNWTYSVSPEGEIVPGMITWAGVTRNDAKLVKVVLDNGEEIKATPDHKFILRNGEKIEAQKLSPGDSLMPLDIINEKLIKGSKQNPYYKVKCNKKNKHKAVHRIISEYFNKPQKKNEVIHHVDFNRYNNNPENLVVMDKVEHIKLHGNSSRLGWENSNYVEHCRKLSESGKKFFKTPEGIERRKEISEFNKNSTIIWEALKNGRKKMLELKQAEKLTMSKEDYHAKWYQSKDVLQQINNNNKIENYYNIDTIINYIDNNFNRTLDAKSVANGLKDIYPKIGINSIRKIFKTFLNVSFQEYMSKTYKESWKWHIKKQFNNDISISDVKAIIDSNFTETITSKEILELIKNDYPTFGHNVLSEYFKLHGFENFCDFMSRTYGKRWKRSRNKYLSKTNHTVVSVTFLDETEDVGTLTIDENHVYHDYHNFGLSAGVFVMNSKGTEIDTLPGGDAFANLDMINYFKKNLYEALNVPPSRLESDNTFNIGRGSEISRDELKFAKFVARLRKQFSHLFLDILKSQLILKKIISSKDWEEYKEFIQFDYVYDNHYNELKEIEILSERMTAVSSLDAYVGKYYSHEYIMRNILKMSEKEIKENQEQIKKEKENNLYLTREEEDALAQQEMDAAAQAAGGMEGGPPPEDQEGRTLEPGGDINAKFRQKFGG